LFTAGVVASLTALALTAVPVPAVEAQSLAKSWGVPDWAARFRKRAAGEVEDTVVSYYVSLATIPTNPVAAAWNRIPPQLIWVPREYDHPDVDEPIVPPNDPNRRPPVKPLWVKSLNNGKSIYFWFLWPDATKDTSVQDPPLFADAVALQVPFDQVNPPPPEVDPVTGVTTPGGIHMGAIGYPVNILFWRADLGRVQNLTGVGEGSVQVTPDAATLGVAHSQAYAGNKWAVVLGRSMVPENPQTQASFARGTTIPIAWSLWDGFYRERNGNKYANGGWDKLKIQ
jgi:DMSO reductase family type II enzyme heme b subunit